MKSSSNERYEMEREREYEREYESFWELWLLAILLILAFGAIIQTQLPSRDAKPTSSAPEDGFKSDSYGVQKEGQHKEQGPTDTGV